MAELGQFEVLSGAEMRAAEAAAMASGAVTAQELMERAGAGVAQAVLSVFGDTDDESAAPPLFGHVRAPAIEGQRAIVVCGPGNNGGDGYVVARHLAQRGWDVTVARFGPKEALSPEARRNLELCHDMGLAPVETLPAGAGQGALVVDAGFGIGVRAPYHAPDLLRNALDGAAFRVAVDLPSGLDAESGFAGGEVAAVDLTVTFHAPKLGHLLGLGPDLCGALAIVDLGLDPTPEAVQGVAAPVGVSKSQGHKFDHGHALVLSGGAGRTGAARLSAHAALRIGAGLVTLGVPPAAQIEVATQVTSVMLTRIGHASDLTEALEDTRISALCLGPGLGLRAREGALVRAALAARRPTVLDADALTLIAQSGLDGVHEACVLTPHGGEFARLFPDLAEDWPQSGQPKTDAVKEAARRAGAVVLLKGRDTVIAAPDGRVALHVAGFGRSAPWLATAGAGDVLAGMIAGLLARGRAPFAAAKAAVWLHVEAARHAGPGLIAEDLPQALRPALRALEP